MFNVDQQLSIYFDLSEFARSSQYPELVEKTLFTAEQINRAEWFCKLFLDRLREHVGWVSPTCANRSMYNHLLSSSHTGSDHNWSDETESLAVDIKCDDMGKAFSWLLTNREMFKLIYHNVDAGFIHISMYDKTHNKGRAFIIENGVKEVL